MLPHRDYNLISCGMIDETIASLALEHSDKLLARNRAIVRDNLASAAQILEAAEKNNVGVIVEL